MEFWQDLVSNNLTGVIIAGVIGYALSIALPFVKAQQAKHEQSTLQGRFWYLSELVLTEVRKMYQKEVKPAKINGLWDPGFAKKTADQAVSNITGKIPDPLKAILKDQLNGQLETHIRAEIESKIVQEKNDSKKAVVNATLPTGGSL